VIVEYNASCAASSQLAEPEPSRVPLFGENAHGPLQICFVKHRLWRNDAGWDAHGRCASRHVAQHRHIRADRRAVADALCTREHSDFIAEDGRVVSPAPGNADRGLPKELAIAADAGALDNDSVAVPDYDFWSEHSAWLDLDARPSSE
jgi:hypothetical protein